MYLYQLLPQNLLYWLQRHINIAGMHNDWVSMRRDVPLASYRHCKWLDKGCIETTRHLFYEKLRSCPKLTVLIEKIAASGTCASTNSWYNTYNYLPWLVLAWVEQWMNVLKLKDCLCASDSFWLTCCILGLLRFDFLGWIFFLAFFLSTIDLSQLTPAL